MKAKVLSVLVVFIFLFCTQVFSAYHHEGESDADNFLAVYPDKAGTKLDHCALCHKGGEYEKKPDVWVELGSCQWCHRTYGYDASGDIMETINPYGEAYNDEGRNTAAITAINSYDSDGDGHTNAAELSADTFPGDDEDYPGLTTAPYRIYTRGQLEAMDQHTQFLLMNTSRSGDFYAQYTGVPIKALLDNAGILDTAEGITVFAPDGWSQDHPLEYTSEPEMYPVYGNIPGETYQYPPSTYSYDTEADTALNTDDGWCDFSVSSCTGRSHGNSIYVEGGLKAILAMKREGVNLDTGVLNDENKLYGEGPYRVVVPQKVPSAPDQSSNADNQEVIWPYNYDWDHNAGACSRSATIIRVDPLPEGTTDINILEAGWSYVDQGKIIVYGAIDGTDSNGNGILDSEEGTDDSSDFDGDGIPDYKDSDTASPKNPNGTDNIVMHTSAGDFAEVKAFSDDDATEVPQEGKPAATDFPYGVLDFSITGLSAGETLTLTLVFPEDIPINALYYKIISGVWTPVPFGSNDGDNTITVSLTDGDVALDADGIANGTIVDPGALGVPEVRSSGSSSSGICFISTIFGR